MKKILSKNIIALVVALFTVISVSAQGLKDIVINEVLVKNVNSVEDDFGNKAGWIELKNSGYSKVNIAGSILRVTKNDGSVINYRMPKSDSRTQISPQEYVLFFADGESTKGTFYLNFTLDNTKSIELYDASGKGEPISSVAYNYASINEDESMGYITKSGSEDYQWAKLPSPTPGATNENIEVESRSEMFYRQDPVGVTMAVTAMGVVFMALLSLFLVFKGLGILLVSFSNSKSKKAAGEPIKIKSHKEITSDEVKGEVIAAIAVALRRYQDDLHDIESEVITINTVARAYSPWSSKIYGLNNQPNRK
ncbi:MAG: OadG family transporter subunit [Rikenellaceae bacterium]